MRDKKRVFVKRETSDEELLGWIEEGRDIFFESGVDSFRELADNIREELDKRALDRYWLAFHHWKDQEKRKGQPAPSGITVEPVASSAQRRIQVDFKDPEFGKKWHECWIRPDEVRERSYRGYVPVGSEEVEVFCSSPAGPPAITDGQGKTEMLLYKIPNELYHEQKAARKQRFAGRLEQDQQRAREEVNKLARESSSEAPDNVFFDPENPRETPGTVRWHEEPAAED
jgi:hypothetical protein